MKICIICMIMAIMMFSSIYRTKVDAALVSQNFETVPHESNQLKNNSIISCNVQCWQCWNLLLQIVAHSFHAGNNLLLQKLQCTVSIIRCNSIYREIIFTICFKMVRSTTLSKIILIHFEKLHFPKIFPYQYETWWFRCQIMGIF